MRYSNDYRQGAQDKDFWVTHIIGAYQGPLDQSYDPASQTYDPLSRNKLRGTTPGKTSFVYRETIRDVFAAATGTHKNEDECVSAIAVHEILHQFDLQHDIADGSIMNYFTDREKNLEATPYSELHVDGGGYQKIAKIEKPQ